MYSYGNYNNNLLSNYLQLKDKKNSDLFYIKAKNIDENFIEFKFNEATYLISNKTYYMEIFECIGMVDVFASSTYEKLDT